MFEVHAEWELIETGDDVAIVVHGEVDIATEEPLIAEIERHVASPTARVSFDLADVQFMDAAGIRLLVRLRQRHGDRVVVSAASTAVERVLSLTGVDDIFTVRTPAT